MLSLVLALLTVTLLSILLVTIVVSFFRTGVPTLASARAAQQQVGEFLARQRVSTIYELGSGKGDFVFQLARQVPTARVDGFEISATFYLFSQLWRLLHRERARIHFHLVDFRNINLSGADALVFYLMPKANRQLQPKFLRELRPGTWVITVSFSMPGWQPLSVLRAPNFSQTRTFIYRMPPEPINV